MSYVDLMVTTNQNPITDTQKIKRKESKHNTKKVINHKRTHKNKKKGSTTKTVRTQLTWQLINTNQY